MRQEKYGDDRSGGDEQQYRHESCRNAFTGSECFTQGDDPQERVAPQSRVIGRCGRVHRDENKEKQDTAEKPVQPENHVVGCSYVVTPAVFPYRESDDERKKQGTYDERREWRGGGIARYARYTLVGVRLPGQRSYGAGVIDDAGFSYVLHQYRGQEHLFLECGGTIERCA